MNQLTCAEAQQALRAIHGMQDKTEKAREKFKPGTSQHTLLTNRMEALRLSAALLTDAESGPEDGRLVSPEALKRAIAPIASLISKSEKALGKTKPGTWQHGMLTENLQALRRVLPILAQASEWGLKTDAPQEDADEL